MDCEETKEFFQISQAVQNKWNQQEKLAGGGTRHFSREVALEKPLHYWQEPPSPIAEGGVALTRSHPASLMSGKYSTTPPACTDTLQKQLQAPQRQIKSSQTRQMRHRPLTATVSRALEIQQKSFFANSDNWTNLAKVLVILSEKESLAFPDHVIKTGLHFMHGFRKTTSNFLVGGKILIQNDWEQSY